MALEACVVPVCVYGSLLFCQDLVIIGVVYKSNTSVMFVCDFFLITTMEISACTFWCHSTILMYFIN